MKSVYRQLYKKLISIVIITIFITPIIGNTVYAYEINSNSIIDFSIKNKNMIIGQKQSLNAVFLFDNKVVGRVGKSAKYESSNPNIIKIDGDNAIAVGKGTATIIAYYNNSKTEIVINVQELTDLEKKELKVTLKWNRESNKINLQWTKFKEFISFRILKKEINETEYKELKRECEGNNFLDEDVLPNHEYFYKIFLMDKDKKEYALNDLKIPIYHETENAKEKVCENNFNNTTKIVENHVQFSKDNIIYEINREQINCLKTEDLVKKSFDITNSENKNEENNNKNDLKKETNNVEEIINKKNFNELENNFHTLYGIEEPIIIKKDKLIKCNNEITLTYYCNENTNINQNNLTIYRIDLNKNIYELENIKLDVKNNMITFFTDKEGTYYIKEKTCKVKKNENEVENKQTNVKEKDKTEVDNSKEVISQNINPNYSPNYFLEDKNI